MRLLFLLFLFTFPVMSQDDDDACKIDLSPIAAQLMQAQAAASEGNTADALAMIDTIQAQLDSIATACQTGEAISPPPATPTSTPEPETQTGQKAILGSYQFELPADWVIVDGDGVTLTGPTEGAARAIIRPNGFLRETEQAAAIVMGDTTIIAPDLPSTTTAREIVALYLQTFANDFLFTIVTDVEEITLGDHTVQQFSFNAPGYSGFVAATELDDNIFLLVITAAAVDQFPLAEDVLNTIFETLQIAE